MRLNTTSPRSSDRPGWRVLTALLLLLVVLEGTVALIGNAFGSDVPPLWVRAEAPASLVISILLVISVVRTGLTLRRPWRALVPTLTLLAITALVLPTVVPIHPRPVSPYSIEVFKAKRELRLLRGQEIVSTFHVALGGCPVGTKEAEGDRKTPEGDYFVCSKGPSQFRKWLGVSYPSTRDASAGRWSGRITWLDYWRILVQSVNGETPLQKTALGGEIGIHGGGNKHDWTLGCIALNNDDVDRLYDTVPVGSPVHVFP